MTCELFLHDILELQKAPHPDRDTLIELLRGFFEEKFDGCEEYSTSIPDDPGEELLSCKCGDCNTLVYAIPTDKALTERSGKKQQYEQARRLMNDYNYDMGIFVFYDDECRFRMSLIYKTYKGSKAKASNFRRFTHFVSPAINNMTFKLQMTADELWGDPEKVKNAFSVEKVSKEFYNKIVDWYNRAVAESVYPFTKSNKPKEQKQKEAILRLITRLMFVWFMKQKGLIPEILFDRHALASVLKDFDPESGDCYYNAILQNLFFPTLSTETDKRTFGDPGEYYNPLYGDHFKYRYKKMFIDPGHALKELFGAIPYVNGGLFDCQDIVYQDKDVKIEVNGKTVTFKGSRTARRNNNKPLEYRSDCFSDYKYRDSEKRARVPNSLFFGVRDHHSIIEEIKSEGILDIFARYNFTVDENTTSDQDIALDPEMLGKIFENLLAAEINPETQESARKSSGSYYTRREIVDFMVDEALKDYLAGKTGCSPDDLCHLFEEDALPAELAGKAYEIAEALMSVRIFDPACGSGAFPMGALHRIIRLLEIVDPLEREGTDFVSEEETPFRRKLGIIKNCIYGADIQPIAAEITMLRCFLSLLIEQQPDPDKDNYGIEPLPSLDFKFMQGNSLIYNIEGKNFGFSMDTSLLFNDGEDKFYKDLKLLEALKDKYYSDITPDIKKTVKRAIFTLADRIAGIPVEDPDQPRNYMLYSIFFSEVKGGFDIIIGNPPYIQLQKDGSRLGDLYKPYNYKTFDRMGDIYCLFYELGFSNQSNLLKPGGTLCYITSKKWMKQAFGEKLRTELAQNTDPRLLIDLGPGQFENATVDTNILLYNKSENTGRCRSLILKQDVLYLRQETEKAIACAFNSSNSWVILSPIEQSIKAKIEAKGTPLKEWNVSINRGILTGYNEAFVINGATKDRLIREDPRSAEIIKPLLQGRDMFRYRADFSDKWLICTFPARNYNIDNYPAVKKHLLSFGKERLEQSGKKNIEVNGERCNARKKTNNKWFEVQDSIAYWQDFEKEKIIWGQLSDKPKFIVDADKHYYIGDSAFYMIIDTCVKYMACFLNSKVSEYYFSKDAPSSGQGTTQWKKYKIIELPVPKITKEQAEHFDDLYDKAEAAGQDTTLLEQAEAEINKAVYGLFDFTEEEIEFIERSVK
ncbi:MAG: Eco57I restriction-modification methylase domain-containing protein [Abditibacteriota bacterium]|nr:Eco57I restriction-modification methylase domain-containing protein [Abditibacteriota bacterium]